MKKKKTVAVKMDEDLAEAVRDAAYWCPGESIVKIFEAGVKLRLQQLADKHNGGKPFKVRETEAETE